MNGVADKKHQDQELIGPQPVLRLLPLPCVGAAEAVGAAPSPSSSEVSVTPARPSWEARILEETALLHTNTPVAAEFLEK